MQRAQKQLNRRTSDLAFALFLFAFGSYGLWVDHLHRLGEDAAGLHLHNVPAPMLCAAMICASFVMVAALFDDYQPGLGFEAGSPSAQIGKLAGGSVVLAALLLASP